MRFLVQSPHAWQDVRQRPHHLLTRIAAAGRNTVHWVQPRYLRWRISERERFERVRDAQPAPNFTVKTVTLANGERLPFVRGRNQRALRDAMLAAPSKGDWEQTILWLYNPHEAHLAQSVPHDVLIYDIMDEYKGFAWSPRNIAAEEADLLARADWVFAGTHALYDAKQPQAQGKIDCILSGVEVEKFAPRPRVDRKARLAELNPAAAAWADQFECIVGYAGTIDQRFDDALAASMTGQFPNLGFMLLGPWVGDHRWMPGRPNVYAPGAVDYEHLPAYYARWDIAWLPFMDSELTRHTNPTKMLEYAAAEVPILARELPEIKRCYSEGAWLYPTGSQCEKLLRKLATDTALRRSRIEFAKQWIVERDWGTLANRMRARVGELLLRKSTQGKP